MRKYILFATVGLLLLLSMLPWIVRSVASRPFVPERLQQAPAQYKATVDTIQAATRVAEQLATSHVEVRILGTVVSSVVAAPTANTSVTQPTATPTAGDSSVTIRTLVPTQDILLPVETSIVPVAPTVAVEPNPSSVPPTPAVGWIMVDDVLTADMLTAQIKQDADDHTVEDLVVTIAPTGISATGTFLVREGVRQPLKIDGMFALEQESLVAKITSIRIAGVDVTDQHRDSLESSLNTSLYRLLPQRYVQSYELADGLVRVHSRMRR